MAEGLRAVAKQMELVAVAYSDAETPKDQRVHELFSAAAGQLVGLADMTVSVAHHVEQTVEGLEITIDQLNPKWVKDLSALSRDNDLPRETRKAAQQGAALIRKTVKRARVLLEAVKK